MKSLTLDVCLRKEATNIGYDIECVTNKTLDNKYIFTYYIHKKGRCLVVECNGVSNSYKTYKNWDTKTKQGVLCNVIKDYGVVARWLLNPAVVDNRIKNLEV